MFRKKSGKGKKVWIQISNMRLIDVPPNQCLMFLKAKQGRTGAATKKYAIVKNSVLFAEPLRLEYELPADGSARPVKPLRLSFRFENPSNSGYTRYGIVELDVAKCLSEGMTRIEMLLSECTYNSYFIALLGLCELGQPTGVTRSSSAGNGVVVDGKTSDESISEASTSSHTPTNTSMCSRSRRSEDSTSSYRPPTIYDMSPVKIPLEKFEFLEHQIDDLLASIINDPDGVSI
jgi:hypothetical protein